MKNTLKTVLCLMMALLLVFGMAACTKSEEPAEQPAEEQTESFSADDMVRTAATPSTSTGATQRSRPISGR